MKKVIRPVLIVAVLASLACTSKKAASTSTSVCAVLSSKIFADQEVTITGYLFGTNQHGYILASHRDLHPCTQAWFAQFSWPAAVSLRFPTTPGISGPLLNSYSAGKLPVEVHGRLTVRKLGFVVRTRDVELGTGFGPRGIYPAAIDVATIVVAKSR